MKTRRTTPRRRLAPRWSAEEWEYADAILRRRCGDRCEKCGDPLRGRVERHHRQRRQVGGDRLANLLMLHPDCHQWITEHPREAMEYGWSVSMSALDPGAVSVLIDQRWWLLTNDGGRLAA